MSEFNGAEDGGTAAGETVGETAYRRMRKDVIFGRLAPGEKLTLDRISQAYGTSISTMRETLSRLGSEGLIVAEGQRGFEVAPVSPADFREVAAMRLLLECHALAQSFTAGDLDWEARVVAAHHKLAVTEKRMIAGAHVDPEAWKRCDWGFHHALTSACGSKLLLEMHGAVYDRYLRYQMVAVIFRGAVAADEHQRLAECALARDAETAQSLLVTHIQGCVDHALAGDTSRWFHPAAACKPTVTSQGRSSVRENARWEGELRFCSGWKSESWAGRQRKASNVLRWMAAVIMSADLLSPTLARSLMLLCCQG